MKRPSPLSASADTVFVLWRHAIERLVDRVGQTTSGVVVAEESPGDGGATGFVCIPRRHDGRQMIIGPGDGKWSGIHQDKYGPWIRGGHSFE